MENTVMSKLVILLNMFCAASAKVALSPKALRCICEVESRCQENIGCKNTSTTATAFACELDMGCQPDLDSLMTCGPYQITEEYWINCGKPGDSFRSCANTMWCSEKCINAFMERWAELCTLYQHKPTDMDMIRIHKGGNRGCHSYNTLEYWNRLKPCCMEGEGTCSTLEEDAKDAEDAENDTGKKAEAAAVFATSTAKSLRLASCWYMIGVVCGVFSLVLC